MSQAPDRFSRLAALRPARAPLPALLRAPEEEDAMARALGASVGTNRYGEHLVVRNWFSTPEYSEPAARTLALLAHARDAALAERNRCALADPQKWLFLDTETTGLTGGTGTYAFLVGLAWWDAGGLQVEQLFMRDFAEEHSVLEQLRARLAERPVLVTFNGKSFDWPLLENRFAMTRSIRTPALAAHLDLLHPARALWKLRLGSVRLAELERHVLDAPRLGWCREDDICSSMIPQFYFDYLRGGTGRPLVGVARHNQMDLRGLAALTGKVNELLVSETSGDVASLDLFGLSRFLDRRGESAGAARACSQALDLGLPAEVRPVAQKELALLAKRRGDHESAALLWHEMVRDRRDSFYACEQLAIHYERRRKDRARAIEFTRLALASLRRSGRPGALLAARRQEQRLSRRLERLERGPVSRTLLP